MLIICLKLMGSEVNRGTYRCLNLGKKDFSRPCGLFSTLFCFRGPPNFVTG